MKVQNTGNPSVGIEVCFFFFFLTQNSLLFILSITSDDSILIPCNFFTPICQLGLLMLQVIKRKQMQTVLNKKKLN